MTTIDKHTIRLTLPDGASIRPISGSLTLDESWEPYAQGQIVIPMPSAPAYTTMDPRLAVPPKLQLSLHRTFDYSAKASDLTALYGGGTIANLTALYGAGTIADLTTRFGRAWVPGETRREQRRTSSLWIAGRVDNGDHTVTLTLASGEHLLEDYKSGGDDDDAGFRQLLAYAGTDSYRLATLVNWVITRVDPTATIVTTTDFDISASYVLYPIFGAGIPWQAGISAWDFLQPFVQAAGARLWCDDAAVWHLDPAPTNLPGALAVSYLNNMVDFSDAVTRDDGTWYNAVQITYLWTDPDGTDNYHMDNAPFPFPAGARVLAIEYQGSVPPADGAAAIVLARAIARGRSVPSRAINDYAAAPGLSTTITTPSSAFAGVLAALSWDFETLEMDLTIRDTGE